MNLMSFLNPGNPNKLSNKLSLSPWERLFLGLVFLRYSVVAIRSFLPLGFPDIWRQVVTLSVSMRYWSKWALESGVQHPLLPAVLDAGETQGIMPMEFPLLNMLGAPFFALGPYWGRAFAILFYNILTLLLVLWNARVWRGKKIAGIEAGAAMLLLPLFSISLPWSSKFMSDFWATLLMCLALGVSWEKQRSWPSVLLATLSLLVKPNGVIVLLLGLGHSEIGINPRRWNLKKILSGLIWICPSLAIAGGYYTLGIQWMEKFRELPSAVGVEPRPFFLGVLSFFQHLPFVFRFYLERAFFLGGALLVFGIHFWDAFGNTSPNRRKLVSSAGSAGEREYPFQLWMISLLQFIGICGIDGGSLFFDHIYYLIGLSPVFCLLFLNVLRNAKQQLLKLTLVLGLLVPLAEACLMDLKTLYRRNPDPIWSIDSQVRELKERNPDFPWRKGKVFRTNPEIFPMLALYFGEISGSHHSNYGFFYKEEVLPTGCSEVDHTVFLVLAKCQ